MRIALLDNGSPSRSPSQPAAAAAALTAKTGLRVEAVSWRHSDRIPPGELDGAPARTLVPWLRAAAAPAPGNSSSSLFVSAEGAIAGRAPS